MQVTIKMQVTIMTIIIKDYLNWGIWLILIEWPKTRWQFQLYCIQHLLSLTIPLEKTLRAAYKHSWSLYIVRLNHSHMFCIVVLCALIVYKIIVDVASANLREFNKVSIKQGSIHARGYSEWPKCFHLKYNLYIIIVARIAQVEYTCNSTVHMHAWTIIVYKFYCGHT